MTRSKSPAKVALEEIVRVAVRPALNSLGFRKTKWNFHHRCNAVVQVVNIQSSHGSTSEELSFYINVGLAFDEICQLSKAKILEKPKEWECDARGTRARLENLLDDVPDVWVAYAGQPNVQTTQRLQTSMTRLAQELESTKSVESYRKHRWFNRYRPKQENAQIMYLLGDDDGAWQEIQDLCETFKDRQYPPKPEWWVKELGLKRLTNRLETI